MYLMATLSSFGSMVPTRMQQSKQARTSEQLPSFSSSISAKRRRGMRKKKIQNLIHRCRRGRTPPWSPSSSAPSAASSSPASPSCTRRRRRRRRPTMPRRGSSLCICSPACVSWLFQFRVFQRNFLVISAGSGSCSDSLHSNCCFCLSLS